MSVDRLRCRASVRGDCASTVFDAGSGLLVASTGRDKAAGSRVRDPLDVDAPEGQVQIPFARIVDVRERMLPGPEAAAPAWVVPGTQLVHTSQALVANPHDPYGLRTGWPIQVVVTVDEVGDSWATHRSTTAMDLDGCVGRSEARGATGSTGLYRCDPASPGVMTSGTRLGEVPVTNARPSVEAAGDPSVTLLTEAPGVIVRAGYDVASGVLTGLVVAQGIAAVTLELISVG